MLNYPFNSYVYHVPPADSHFTFVKDPKGRTAKEKFIDNPLVTDVTLREQCELQYLFQQNPDITGLSLVADDKAAEERTATVSVEDFLPAKDHYDIHDMAEFIDNAKQQFNKLPVKLRMMYNNNPMELVDAMDKDYGAALANMQQFFSPVLPASQSSATPAVGSQDTTDTKVDKTVVKKSSSDVSDNV